MITIFGHFRRNYLASFGQLFNWGNFLYISTRAQNSGPILKQMWVITRAL
jgi:hypothetical protein